MVPHWWRALWLSGRRGKSLRLSTMSYPNGQVMTNTYFGNLGDQRLQEILNQNASSATISKFDYAYNAVGDITTWTQQVDNTTTNSYNLTYDRGDQLLGATLQNTTTLAVLTNYYYAYDAAGNRTSEQVNSNVTQAAVNDLNQITSQSGGGAMRVRGSVNETSTVVVAGQSVSVVWTNLAGSNTLFDTSAQVTVGTNDILIIATDYSNNASTNDYQVVVSNQTTRTLLYDLNGNLTNITSGSASTNFQWDAVNRLVGIVVGGGSSSTSTVFRYDGLSRRVRITELTGTATNTDKQFVWCGTELCEERDTTGTNVTRRFFAQGEQIGSTNYFFARDHLGSVREMVDTNGTIRARYNYAPYGRRSANQVTVNPVEADFGFTGHYFHAPSGLHLALYRAYSADLGRWLSRDPMAEIGGPSLYGYVANNPLKFYDPQGLFWGLSSGWSAVAIAGIGALAIGAAIVTGGAAIPFLIPVLTGATVGGTIGEAIGGDQGGFNGALAGAAGGVVPGIGALAEVGTVGTIGLGALGGATASGIGWELNKGTDPWDSSVGMGDVSAGAFLGGLFSAVGCGIGSPLQDLGYSAETAANSAGILSGIGAGVAGGAVDTVADAIGAAIRTGATLQSGANAVPTTVVSP